MIEDVIASMGHASIVFSRHPPAGYVLVQPGNKVKPGDIQYLCRHGWRPTNSKTNSKIHTVARKHATHRPDNQVC